MAGGAWADLPNDGPEARRTSHGIPYVTGGVGISERGALLERAEPFNVRLTFAAPGGAYDVRVVIEDEESGERLVDETSNGPFFWVDLPGGRYVVRAIGASGDENSFEATLGEGEDVSRVIHLRSAERGAS